MKQTVNIYITGVGGQGVGVLSEVLTRACLAAGYRTLGCDTHGIAQRGGTTVSHLRIGESLFGPLIPRGGANLVIALERLEAARATRLMMTPGGRLIYCDAVHQPIAVRMGDARYPTRGDVARVVESLGGTCERVRIEDIPNPRFHNTVLIARLVTTGAVEGLKGRDVVDALRQVATSNEIFQENRTVFESLIAR